MLNSYQCFQLYKCWIVINVFHFLVLSFSFRADRETMLSKAKGDDVELGATLLTNEQKVDLHVPESPGKSWWNLKNVIDTAR